MSKLAALCALALSAVLTGACASPTHTVDPHPGLGDPQRNTYAYQAQDGSIAPATTGDAGVAAAAAAVDTAMGIGNSPNLAAPNRISGYCVMVGNQEKDKDTQLPCSSILIKLLKKDGTEVGQQRTDESGHFFFNVNYKDRYKIEVPSTLFVATIKPSKLLKAGAVVKVKLKQKQMD